MNAEPPQTNEPKPDENRIPAIVWLLVALSPFLLIMLVLGGHIFVGGAQGLIAVLFLVNPLLSFCGCSGLLNRPGSDNAGSILGGILLGAVFTVLNIGIGAFVGCSLSGHSTF